jgi:hypothetical protein
MALCNLGDMVRHCLVSKGRWDDVMVISSIAFSSGNLKTKLKAPTISVT